MNKDLLSQLRHDLVIDGPPAFRINQNGHSLTCAALLYIYNIYSIYGFVKCFLAVDKCKKSCYTT